MFAFARAARRVVVGLALFVGFSASAHATRIEYETTHLSGDSWRYDYTVTNDTLGASLDEFTIFFSLGLYQNVMLGGAPAGWDPLAIEPDPNLPDDGFYDALALGPGLAPGTTLGGFFAVFDWLGAGTPASQMFNVVDALTIETLETGFTVPRATTPPVGVPEPGVLALFAAAMLGALSALLIKRDKSPND